MRPPRLPLERVHLLEILLLTPVWSHCWLRSVKMLNLLWTYIVVGGYWGRLLGIQVSTLVPVTKRKYAQDILKQAVFIMLYSFTKTCIIQLIMLPHAKLYMILGCCVWMYAKLFHAKLCYLMLHCLSWPNTMQFYPRLTHLTSCWTASFDSEPFHVAIPFLLCINCCSYALQFLCIVIPFDTL